MGLLEVKNLKMYYKSRRGWIKAVDDVSFRLDRGEMLGVVGESGCGKTSLGLSILKLLPPNGWIVDGQIFLDDLDLTTLPEEKMRKIRGKRISMIFQAALNALNPVFKVGDLLTEALRLHEECSKGEARRRVAEMVETVGISSSMLRNYPHELSGGMRQRALIVMSLICGPDLVIADEPATALDVVIQDQIFGEIEDLQKKLNFSMIIISHDSPVILETCDKIMVIYGGRLVEYADAAAIFNNPCNPYTIGLFQSIPSIHGPLKKLVNIPGRPPSLLNTPTNCLFEPRCPLANKICREKTPPLTEVENGHFSRCFRSSDPELKDIQFLTED